ncbi:MAG: hypothetical protein ACFFDF_19450 [Candidatus Odinarchaeota archaeon]
MSEGEQQKDDSRRFKFLNGPGMGLTIMGFAYVLWWFVGPWAWSSITMDPRWIHNWAYALIIFNVGLAWYHKSPLSRSIAMIQSIMLPITASGSFNTTICTIITACIFLIWFIIVLIEKTKKRIFFQDKLTDKGKLWLNMHTLIIAWILIAHMGLMFFVVRFPLEFSLYQISNQAGFLANLPPEGLEFATWTYDIGLFAFLIVVLWEQYKLGYNIKGKPWPRLSFYTAIIVMVLSLFALLIQELTIGFEWITTIYGP